MFSRLFLITTVRWSYILCLEPYLYYCGLVLVVRDFLLVDDEREATLRVILRETSVDKAVEQILDA